MTTRQEQEPVKSKSLRERILPWVKAGLGIGTALYIVHDLATGGILTTTLEHQLARI